MCGVRGMLHGLSEIAERVESKVVDRCLSSSKSTNPGEHQAPAPVTARNS